MKLKLVTPGLPLEDEVFYITPDNFLAYKKDGAEVKLDKGGQKGDRLITCQNLKDLLSRYLFKGTKYIINTYNPILHYLIPGNPSNDSLFNADNNFIPTIPTQDSTQGLIRNEVDGFNEDFEVTQKDVRCIKACDNWYNNMSELAEIEDRIDSAIKNIFGYYKNFDDLDMEKEVKEVVGEYSIDITTNPFTASLNSETKYTDTINIEDWIYASLKSNLSGISGKLDVSYLYSKGGVIYSGEQCIKAFRYEEYLTPMNTIMDLGDVQIELMDKVLKIYPLSDDIDEVIFSDCTLTIGAL